ncbi:MAG: amidase, partial [Actinobacteria bacterium]|nr:amidase [Actinomycetota bacterium]
MVDGTWQGDAASLVDAFRRKERSPVEELQATYAAIDASNLNAFCFLDRERALAAAERVDVSMPFGGVPLGVKELERNNGWPDTDASLVFKDRIATTTDTMLSRASAAGAVLVGQTTSSEFGGVNLTRTMLHGATHNPWQHGRTPGGSSGGSAAAVAGGLVTIATGGDGGGSIRIPAGFTGLVGLKATYGRIPRGPGSFHRATRGASLLTWRSPSPSHPAWARSGDYNAQTAPSRGPIPSPYSDPQDG